MITTISTAILVVGLGFALPLMALILYVRLVMWMYGTARGPIGRDSDDE